MVMNPPYDLFFGLGSFLSEEVPFMVKGGS